MHGLAVAGNHAHDWTLPIWRRSNIEDIHWVDIGHKAVFVRAVGLAGCMNGDQSSEQDYKHPNYCFFHQLFSRFLFTVFRHVRSRDSAGPAETG
jgi:hypothetical protein